MKIVVGLGSNLGDRLAMMRAAVAAIDALVGARVVARSRLYETAPVGGPEQGPFLNAAIAVAWEGDAVDFMAALLDVERRLGRVRDVRWGPRTIDLDVLWIDGLVLETPSLVVPHPELTRRAFAVRPLLDVAPDAADPRTGEPYVAPSGQDLALATAEW